MLGLDNPIHILFVLVIVLLVFGAKRLPEMGKSLGEGLRGFKDSVSGDSHPAAHLAHMTADHRDSHAEELPAAPAPVVEPSEPRTARQTPLTPAA
ncbi:MAG TPA: twin-arginine translocase TatA/TatE family subunit [Solirubrobacteraceae bacterium]|jgi:sec-independent protein translocase protein TatA|nr:twin-arginine translocase TatA/TatE family subunit [Solirubrobacteraceae bacterium]